MGGVKLRKDGCASNNRAFRSAYKLSPEVSNGADQEFHECKDGLIGQTDGGNRHLDFKYRADRLMW